jgi:hypothetical protein
MSDIPQLSREAVELVLAVLEAEQPFLNGAAAELSPGPVALLKAAGLLVQHGHEQVSASLADDDDSPVSLIPTGETGGLAYFSRASGLTTIPNHRLQRHRIEMAPFLSAVATQLDLPKHFTPRALVEGYLWEVGAARLPQRSARVPVWFARRLWDPSVGQKVAAAVAARPHPSTTILLCSSTGRRVANVMLSGTAVMALRDVLVDDATLVASAEIMNARLRGVPAPAQGPIVLSPDGTRLTILGGDPIPFKSSDQIAAIRQLVDAYYAGTRLRARDLSHHGSLDRLFGGEKWKRLKPYLASKAGLWGFEL